MDNNPFEPIWMEQNKIKQSLIGNATINDYQQAFKEIKREHKLSRALENPRSTENTTSLIDFLQLQQFEYRLNYIDPDDFCYIRLFLESCDRNASVTFDVSWWSKNHNVENLRDNIINDLLPPKGVGIFSKILVITEGPTDAKFLSRAIKLRYPHLSDYYLFMPYSLDDSTSNNIHGSASLTVQRIEAFAKCEISNRIIGLLDNDKASVDAITNAKIRSLPDNIKIINYPNITIANTYPCIQSDGTTKNENVNGKAAAIEMYCGRDVLTMDTTPNTLHSIHWTEKANQGNFGSAKNEIQRKIKAKLDACERTPTKINNYDWSGLDAIFETIFQCFQDNTSVE